MKHGAGTYRRGLCRCEDCRRDHTARKARENLAREARLAELPPDAHGKRSTYTNWLCRCEPCTEANRAAGKNWRRKPAQAKS